MPRLNPETGLKKCTKCNEEKSSSDFHKHTASPDGLKTHCKKCREKDRGGQRQYYKYDPETRLKKCKMCQNFKVISDFPKDSSKLHGVHSKCKICTAEYQKQHYKIHKQEIKLKNRIYVEKNKELVRQRQRRWVQNNIEHCLNKGKQWRLNNLEKAREINRNYKRRNPDKRRKYSMTRRARINNAFVEEVDPIIVYKRDNGICQLCFTPIEQGQWHIDHIIPICRGGEHSYANTQLTHAFCNLSKGGKMPINEVE